MFRWDQGDRTQKHTQKYCKFDLILVEPGLIEQIRYNKKMLLRPSSSKLNVDFVAMRQSESPGTINRSMPSTQFEISFINTNSWGNDNKKTRPIGHRHRHSANTIKYIRCTLVVLLSNMRTHALSTLCLWYFVFTRNRKKIIHFGCYRTMRCFWNGNWVWSNINVQNWTNCSIDKIDECVCLLCLDDAHSNEITIFVVILQNESTTDNINQHAIWWKFVY